MQERRDLDHVIDAIYRAGVGTLDTESLLKAACGLLGFRMGVVFSVDQRADTALRGIFWGEQAEQLWLSSRRVDQHRARDLTVGDVHFFELPALCLPDGFRAEASYGVCICLEDSKDRFVCVELVLASEKADRGLQAVLLQTLAPHWVRAYGVYLRLDHAESLGRAYRDSTNMSRHPIVIFDNWGNIFIANTAAETLTREDGISITTTGVKATLEVENKRLQRELSQAVAAGGAAHPAPAGVSLRITRSASKSPLHLLITPLLGEHPSVARKPAAMLIVFDPESRPAVQLTRCREIFGFTRAEAEVALGIMQGRSVEQLAQDQRRQASTTRNLLKRVFQKAGVNRQQELLCMMLNSPLLIPQPAPDERAHGTWMQSPMTRGLRELPRSGT